MLGLVDARVGDLDGVDGQAGIADDVDPVKDLLDGQEVARRMIQHVERLPITHHLAHVLRERSVVDFDPRQHQHALVAGRDLEPVVVADAIVVVRDGEEVVTQITIARDDLVDRTASIGERGVGVEIASQKGHGTVEREIVEVSEERRLAWDRACGVARPT